MKVDFENDLDKNLMHMTIEVDKRNFVNEPRITMSWRDVESLLSDRYSPPNNYELGDCHDKWKKINNDNDNLCEQVWTFNLIPPQSKTTRTKKTTTKSKTAKK